MANGAGDAESQVSYAGAFADPPQAGDTEILVPAAQLFVAATPQPKQQAAPATTTAPKALAKAAATQQPQPQPSLPTPPPQQPTLQQAQGPTLEEIEIDSLTDC